MGVMTIYHTPILKQVVFFVGSGKKTLEKARNDHPRRDGNSQTEGFSRRGSGAAGKYKFENKFDD